MAEKRQKNGMSREEARAMYDTLRKNLNTYLAGQKQEKRGKAATSPLESREGARVREASNGGLRTAGSKAMPRVSREQLNRGQRAAVLMVLLCAAFKMVLGAMEMSGVMSAAPVEASLLPPAERHVPVMKSAEAAGFGPEEVKVLTTLDARRAELEERGRRLDERSRDLDKRDAEYVSRLAELRELTQRLKGDREKNDKKREGQLDQLANVYGSMNPQEAAALIDQLDIAIALPLLQRMPEKRMAQVLALMAPQRALSMTKMLSGMK